jgi:hypothetical protein
MDERQTQRWVTEQVVEPMRSSAMVSVVWSDKVDWKIAVEMGAALLLDKPIVVGVTPGSAVPSKLATIADAIVELDPADPQGTADRLASAVAFALRDSEPNHPPTDDVC